MDPLSGVTVDVLSLAVVVESFSDVIVEVLSLGVVVESFSGVQSSVSQPI